MWDRKTRVSSWWSSSLSFSRVLLLVTPLILVLALVALLGSKNSNWVLTSQYGPWLRSSSLSYHSPSSTIGNHAEEVPSSVVSNHNPSASHPSPSSIIGNDAEEVPSSVASNHNPSASPAPAMAPMPILPSVAGEEGSLNGHQSVHPMSANHSVPMTATLHKEHGSLETLEAGLGRARAAIIEAEDGTETQDPDYVPDGPMYWNATAFHRSYKEMEKQFKVYIYEEGEPPVFHYGPCKQTYAIEGYFIQNMEISKFRTRDPTKAHVYFLPFSVTMITQVIYLPDSHDWSLMKRTASDYVDVISQKYPYWNRSLGADHVMLACHDWGPEISFSVPYLYRNSIRALCNANTSERFNPSRDVSIPEIHLPTGTTEGLLGGPSASKRSILVFYAGGVHGPIRPILLEHWENKDKDVQVHKYLPKGTSYYGMMRQSRFCICPSGYEVASPRMVEALYMGCVPVLIKDHYVIPFSDVMNWKTFSVIVAVEDIPNLKTILMGISQRQYLRMQMRGKQVRRHFEVNSPPKRFDVFHMILHSIWLRRLNVRVYGSQEQ